MLSVFKRLESALDEYAHRVGVFTGLTNGLLGYASGLQDPTEKMPDPTGVVPRAEELANRLVAVNRRLEEEVLRLGRAVNGQGDH